MSDHGEAWPAQPSSPPVALSGSGAIKCVSRLTRRLTRDPIASGQPVSRMVRVGRPQAVPPRRSARGFCPARGIPSQSGRPVLPSCPIRLGVRFIQSACATTGDGLYEGLDWPRPQDAGRAGESRSAVRCDRRRAPSSCVVLLLLVAVNHQLRCAHQRRQRLTVRRRSDVSWQLAWATRLAA